MIIRSTEKSLMGQSDAKIEDDIIPENIETNHFTKQHAAFARGSYSKIYRGIYAGKPVAVKYVEQQPDYDDYFKSQQVEIIKELQAARAPHVLRLLAYTKPIFQTYFLILPLMAQGSLDTHIQDTKKATQFSESLRLNIMLGVAKALAFMHELFILHCDVKPANILLDELFTPYLTDFDTSVKVDTKEPVCKQDKDDDFIRGSRMYTAPELMSVEGYTTHSDVYSFAVSLWEILAWQMAGKALERYSDSTALREIVDGFRDVIPADWAANIVELIASGWQKNATERPSMPKMRDELEQHITSLKLKM